MNKILIKVRKDVVIISSLIFIVLCNRIYCELPNGFIILRKMLFVSKRTTLMQYLDKRIISVTNYLNSNFTKENKIIYLFREFGIYCEPELYQASRVGAASIIYRTADKEVILEKLNNIGIEYLCVDARYGINEDMIECRLADITTPIFEPNYFTKHFVPVCNSLDINNFYLFKINYSGLVSQDMINKNFEQINKTGFFEFLYKAIDNNIRIGVPLENNPYDANVLLSSYKQIKNKIHFSNKEYKTLIDIKDDIKNYISNLIYNRL